MKYIVTGSSTFIGTHLINRLKELNHTVIVLNNFKNLNNIIDLFQCVDSIDGVFHLASVNDTQSSCYDTNILGSLNILEACRIQNIERVILTSSLESQEKSSLMMECLGNMYTDIYSLSVINLRLSTVYGHNQTSNILDSVLRCKRNNEYFEISGDSTRDFIHINDVVDAYMCAMNSSICGIFDICSGVNTSLNDICSMLKCPVTYTDNDNCTETITDPINTYEKLQFKTKIELCNGIKEFLPENKLTIITNVYNEEYLLPFWIEHHKKLMDNGIIDHVVVVDYRSTDNSMNIIRNMCPTWEIVTTKNQHFGAEENDNELMEIEQRIMGYKLILNTTEFLMCTNTLKHSFNNSKPECFEILSDIVITSNDNYYPLNCYDMFRNIEKKVSFVRSPRFLHSYPTGEYLVGRHMTKHSNVTSNHFIQASIYWFGMFFLNDNFMIRKLQIKNNIPLSDLDKGFSIYHFWDEKRIRQEYESLLDSTHPIVWGHLQFKYGTDFNPYTQNIPFTEICFITSIYGNSNSSCKPFKNQTIHTDFICFTDNSNIINNEWIVDSTPYHTKNKSGLDNDTYINSICNNPHPYNVSKYYKVAFQNIPILKKYKVICWIDETVEITNEKTSEYILKYIYEHKMMCWNDVKCNGSLGSLVLDLSLNKNNNTDDGQPHQNVYNQYDTYLRMNFREHVFRSMRPDNVNYGVWLTSFVAYVNNDDKITEFLNNWYYEILTQTNKDEISFPLVCQKVLFYPYTLPDDNVNGDKPHLQTDLYINHA